MYNTDGSIIGTERHMLTIADGTSFHGTSGLKEQTDDLTLTYSSAVGGSTSNTKNKVYSNFVGGEFFNYGFTSSTTLAGNTTNVLTYFSPPASTAPFQPALNTPYSRTYTTVTEVDGKAQPASTQTVTTTFSVEQITVLAGTFQACKLKSEVSGPQANVYYTWTVGSGRLKGITLKQAGGDGVKRSEAKVILLNGQ